jgi:undecaprenyl-diphosphatase
MILRDPFLRMCLIVGLLCLLVSVALSAAIAGDNALVRFDKDLAVTLHDHTRSPLIEIFRAISWLGPAGVWLIGLIGATWLIAGGKLVNTGLKEIFDRERPHFPHPLTTESSAGFPSGHAMMALLGYGFLIVLLWPRLPNRRARIALVGSAALFVLLIGFSRLYLGIHYFSDVIAGYTMGGAWLLLWAGVLRVAERKRRV